MSVRDVYKFHGAAPEQLSLLGTRHLLEILKSSRGRAICSCGKGNHCGDEVLTKSEKDFNHAQRSLFANVKIVLRHREPLTKKPQKTKVKEKKKMKY